MKGFQVTQFTTDTPKSQTSIFENTSFCTNNVVLKQWNKESAPIVVMFPFKNKWEKFVDK